MLIQLKRSCLEATMLEPLLAECPNGTWLCGLCHQELDDVSTEELQKGLTALLCTYCWHYNGIPRQTLYLDEMDDLQDEWYLGGS